MGMLVRIQGMGAYTPVPQVPEEAVQQAISQVLKPTAKGMVAEKRPFQGILYAGLIQTATGPKVIEFNARFGDPETQVVLARLESPLSEIISSLLVKEQPTIAWNELASVGVVVAAEGYLINIRQIYHCQKCLVQPSIMQG